MNLFEKTEDKLYSASELDDLLKHLAGVDRDKIEGCQFKYIENYPDDDSGDVYYTIAIFKEGNEIGVIDMYYHSNKYFDLEKDEFITLDDKPYYTYKMTLYEDLLKHLSEADRNKIKGCQFKVSEDYPDDGSCDVYYTITIFMFGFDIGKIDMHYHSNKFFDIEENELITLDGKPHYTYEMTLYYDDLKEESNGTENLFDDSREESNGTINPFDDLSAVCEKCGKLVCTCDIGCKKCGQLFCTCNIKCKKCGKLFCTCNTFFTNKE